MRLQILLKLKKKKFEFFIDCGNPPSNIYNKNYQAGCLAFELISNKQKIILIKLVFQNQEPLKKFLFVLNT